MPTSRALAKQVVAAYASALFEAASSEGSVDAVAAQLDDTARTVRAHANLRDALLESAIPAENRANIVREVFSAMDPALVTTLALMAERGEFDLLTSVADAYTQVSEERRNVVTVEVTTAVELDERLREAVRTKLAADYGKEVVLQERVDPSIIGGIVISAHGKRLDASISSQLEAARLTLSTAHTGGEA